MVQLICSLIPQYRVFFFCKDDGKDGMIQIKRILLRQWTVFFFNHDGKKGYVTINMFPYSAIVDFYCKYDGKDGMIQLICIPVPQ